MEFAQIFQLLLTNESGKTRRHKYTVLETAKKHVKRTYFQISIARIIQFTVDKQFTFGFSFCKRIRVLSNISCQNIASAMCQETLFRVILKRHASISLFIKIALANTESNLSFQKFMFVCTAAKQIQVLDAKNNVCLPKAWFFCHDASASCSAKISLFVFVRVKGYLASRLCFRGFSARFSICFCLNKSGGSNWISL